MKKIIALALCVVMALSMGACTSKKSKSDLEYVKNKGVLVVGITEFEPMDYKDASGNWVGFDAEMAAAFAASLGVRVEFQVIEWGEKVLELNGKTIDVVWNGMTLTDEVTSAMECSVPYCNNAQVVVVKKSDASKYQTEESLKNLNFAVEDGGAAQKLVAAKKWNYTPVTDQAQTLMEVKSGTSDATVIDWLMAGAMIGEGTNYADLTYTVKLNTEQYVTPTFFLISVQ